MKTILITGAGGLVGSGISKYFLDREWNVVGIDNNCRASFFGEDGSVRNNIKRMEMLPNYTHWWLDVRDELAVNNLFAIEQFAAVVHAAAQPSHDWAAKDPQTDFGVNAVGTLNMLEATRNNCRDAPFIYMSTSKVYGDNINRLAITETDKRYDFSHLANGINEQTSIDQCLHSLFGVSKLTGDLLTQEYGRYFNMSTCVLRPGCISGGDHAGVPLHGFLNYAARCIYKNDYYHILGYDGKQVRDNIHPVDIARFIEMFIARPRSGIVYNIGGGVANSCSVLEALELIGNMSGKETNFQYTDTPRIGDHRCYYSDMARIQKHYPEWGITRNLESIIEEIIISVQKQFTKHV